MRIHLIALALATLDSFILLTIRQTQVIDTSVWIAVIAMVGGILTLIIQTYGQVQVAKLKQRQDEIKLKQDELAAAAKEQTKKLDDQGIKIQEVHTTVNSKATKMEADMNAMMIELNKLKGAAEERSRADTKELSRQQGAAEERNKPTPPAAAA